MTAVMLALGALIGLSSPVSTTAFPVAAAAAAARVDIPLTAPAGWTTKEQDGATVLTPPDVGEGKLYAVMVTLLPGKAGSLDEILADGRKMVADIGQFEAASEPKESASEGGWGYKLVIGTIKTADRSVLAALVSIKRAEAGGVVLVISDSVETMQHYADPLGAMLRGMGTTVTPAAPTSTATADLRYTVPEGWTEQRVNGLPLLVKEKHEQWVNYRISLMVFPSEALTGSIRECFGSLWQSFIQPNYTTTVVPLPMMTRLPSGYACAFDVDSAAKAKNGAEMTAALYVIAHGGRVVPVMGIYSGLDWSADNKAESEIAHFLETAQIPGTSADKVPLFAAADLRGDWSESSSSYANYVTPSGGYAGDASIFTGSSFDLRADGTYTHVLIAITGNTRIKERNEGTWTVDDGDLVLSKGGRYSLLGYGSEPKAGRFLVVGNYSNLTAHLRFTNPRGVFQALWLKAK